MKRSLLVTCSRPQRPPSCTQTCWAVYGKKVAHGRGPCINHACFLKKRRVAPAFLSLSLSTCAKGQTLERDWGRVAIPSTIYRAPEPEFPKIAVETAGKLAGKLGVLGGVLGELLWRLPLLCSPRLSIGFGRTYFSRIFRFGWPDFFPRMLSPDCFSVPRNRRIYIERRRFAMTMGYRYVQAQPPGSDNGALTLGKVVLS